MKQTTLLAAPQVRLSDRLFGKWMETHTGTEDDFLRFLTAPSADRKDFLDSLDCDVRIEEGLGTATYTA